MSTAELSADEKKHPRGLYVLFVTEAAERFSYYGMRALLVLYLITELAWQPSRASGVYKWYTSLVYLTPLIGGFIADRKLGLRLSIITGGVLMAIGHFLMAFKALPMFYAALAFLIAGNGFFKPNISTLVGKLYKKDDARRDGAFTIFYMGINLGAGLAPWICGEWLRKHYGFHYGFAAAGIVMAASLVVFLLGQKQILKDVAAAGNDLTVGKKSDEGVKASASEPDEAEPGLGGVAGVLARVYPMLLIGLSIAVPALFVVRLVRGQAQLLDVLMPALFSGIGGWMGFTLMRIKGAARDKSTVIFVLFCFVVLFWMAFEQAGNALNIWAEVNTDRRLTSTYEYSAEIWQSANAVMIVGFAPLFAMLWTYLIRKKIVVSTPAKMFIAMTFMALSFLAMVGGAIAENRVVSTVELQALPASVKNLGELDAGRMSFDANTHELSVRGVLAPFSVTDALEKTLDPAFKATLDTLEKKTKDATKNAPATFTLTPLPPNFVWPFDAKAAEEVGVAWNGETKSITFTAKLDDKAKAALVAAAADPVWRDTLQSLAKQSEKARVGGFWLLLSYLLATLGELCLSPVGLSMVTKLAPARFASVFMGVWLLSSSVAQYVGGSLGEQWGEIPPTDYFWIFVGTSLVGAVVLFVLIRPVRQLMHKVT